MRASFPVEFTAHVLGKSREAGGFDTSEGRVEYGDAYDLAFESSDGLAQTVRVGVKQLDAAADFDIAKQPKFAQLRVVGDVNLRDDGGSFRPTEVRLVKAS